MLIDKYIEEMVKLRQAHGPELEVLRSTAAVDSDVSNRKAIKAGLPRIANRQIGHHRTLFRDGVDPDRLKGEKVVVIL
jgi:hypothetical protein